MGSGCLHQTQGLGWLEKKNDGILVEEASKEEINDFTERLKLLKLIEREKEIKKDVGLEDHELLITFSPQIDRLKVDNSNIICPDGKNGTFYRSIFEPDVSPGLTDYLTGRLYEHYAVRLISSRDKLQKVRDAVKSNGGFMKMLK